MIIKISESNCNKRLSLSASSIIFALIVEFKDGIIDEKKT